MLTLPLPQVGFTIVKVIWQPRISTVVCSCLLLLLLLLMMCNASLRRACQPVDCRLLLPCHQPVVVADANFSSVWKRLLAVVVMHNSQCLLCCFSSTIDTCHCCYHRRIACGIYKMHLPVFLSWVALAIAIAITAGWLLLPLTKKIVCLILTAGSDEI